MAVIEILMALIGTWSSPTVSGTRPTPCKECSLTMIDERYALLFGGTQPGPRISNDMYMLDIVRMVCLQYFLWYLINTWDRQRYFLSQYMYMKDIGLTNPVLVYRKTSQRIFLWDMGQ